MISVRIFLVLVLQAVFALTAAAGTLPAPYRMSQRVIVPQRYYEALRLRGASEVNPKAVTNTTCINPSETIVSYDEKVAELAICGMAGSTTSTTTTTTTTTTTMTTAKTATCGSTTTGRSGTALFTLAAAEPGASISLSRDAWAQCVAAARAVCPTGSLSATCVGGATVGNVDFTLARA